MSISRVKGLNLTEINSVKTVTQHVAASFPTRLLLVPFAGPPSRQKFFHQRKVSPLGTHTINVQCCLNNIPELHLHIKQTVSTGTWYPEYHT